MIRIEDQEDVEAFNEAKAEIDDEFDEMEGNATEGPKSTTTVAPKEGAETAAADQDNKNAEGEE